MRGKISAKLAISYRQWQNTKYSLTLQLTSWCIGQKKIVSFLTKTYRTDSFWTQVKYFLEFFFEPWFRDIKMIYLIAGVDIRRNSYKLIKYEPNEGEDDDDNKKQQSYAMELTRELR